MRKRCKIIKRIIIVIKLNFGYQSLVESFIPFPPHIYRITGIETDRHYFTVCKQYKNYNEEDNDCHYTEF